MDMINSRSHRNKILLVVSVFILLFFVPLNTIAEEGRRYPFTAEEDADGARFVWFIYKQSGFPYDYLPANRLRESPNFRQAPDNKPQPGDVAWWKEFVAIYSPDRPSSENLLTAPGARALDELQKKYEPVIWLRYWKDN